MHLVDLFLILYPGLVTFDLKKGGIALLARTTVTTVAEWPSHVCEYVCLCVYHVLLEGCHVLLDDIPSIYTDTQPPAILS